MSEQPPQNDNALNEAPGIAWTTLYTKTGGKINLTIRAFSGREALDELVETVIYAKEKYHFDVIPVYPENKPAHADEAPGAKLPEPKASVLPVKASPGSKMAEEGEQKVITVEHVKKVINENGKTFVKVFGQPFTKFGVIAWPETCGDLFDIDAMEIGKEYQPENLKATLLIVDGKPKKVLSFT